MVQIVCLRYRYIVNSVALEADDVWSEVFLRLQRRNPLIPDKPSLFNLVKTCAHNFLMDKGRKNKRRQAIFEENLDSGETDCIKSPLREFDPRKCNRPDQIVESAEMVSLIERIASEDAKTAEVFEAIRLICESGGSSSVTNLAVFLKRPYAEVRRARIRLQDALRGTLLGSGW